MTIKQLLTALNKPGEVFKQRILILIVIIFFILGAIASWAQNVVIPAFDLQSLLLKQAYCVFLFFPEARPVLPKIKQANTQRTHNTFLNRDLFKAAYNKPRVDEKELLRQDWEEAFGVDMWYPYYKYKEIEGVVKKKLSIKVLKFKGEPFFEKNKILYVVKTKF